MTTIHDSGYKILFSNRTIFRQLMQSFVPQPWVEKLDFDRAEKVDKSFIDEEYRERESDLIYRIPFGEDELYVYVLLEFQSTVDRLMALRVLNYVIHLYMELTRNQHLEKLPPVFPIVLYNGEGRWTAATDIAELIESEPSLGEYGLSFRYFKLAENELSRDALHKIGNIVSTLFLAEARYDLDAMLAELVALFDREEDKRAVSLLINWFRQMALHKRIRPEDYARLEEAYHSSEEVRTMLVTNFEKYEQTVYEKGREEGREEGHEASRTKLVLAMIRRGFALDMIADLFDLNVDDVEEIIARETTPPDAESASD